MLRRATFVLPACGAFAGQYGAPMKIMHSGGPDNVGMCLQPSGQTVTIGSNILFSQCDASNLQQVWYIPSLGEIGYISPLGNTSLSISFMNDNAPAPFLWPVDDVEKGGWPDYFTNKWQWFQNGTLKTNGGHVWGLGPNDNTGKAYNIPAEQVPSPTTGWSFLPANLTLSTVV